MKLTSFENGLTIDIDEKKIESFGPHIDGGSFIKVNGYVIRVAEVLHHKKYFDMIVPK